MNKRLIIIAVYSVVGTFCCMAQTVSSVEEQYHSEKCRTVPVVCINPDDNNNSIVCYNDSAAARPCFVYHMHSGAANSRKFPWPDISNIYGSMSYKVNDMVIIDGLCYFCGRKTAFSGYEYTPEGYLALVSQTTGFFGWFPVSQISDPYGTTLDLYLFDIPVSELNRMVGFSVSGVVELGLISETTLALVKGSGSSWIFHLQDAAPTETLEDIEITPNHLVTLSRFANSPFSFGLRCETRTVAFNAPSTHILTNYYNGIKYDTQAMTTTDLPGETPTEHTGETPMRVVAHPGTDLVTVAYDGLTFDRSDCEHFGFYTPMYLMDFSNCSTGYVNIAMSDAQLVTTSLLNVANYSLWEICYVTTNNTIAMLHGMGVEEYGMWSVLQILSWNPAYNPQSLQADSKVFRSMDVGANGWAYMTGWREAEKNLLHFRQDGSTMTQSCQSTRPSANAKKLINEADEVLVTVEPSGIPFPWSTDTPTHITIDSTMTGHFIECTTSY